MARKNSTPSRKASSVAQAKAREKDKGKPKDNVPTTPCPICGKAGHLKKDCWYNIPGGWEDYKPKDKSKGHRREGQDPCQQPAAGEQKQECAGIATARDTVVRRRTCRLWREEPSSSSGATGETTLSGFFLDAFGIDSGAARSAVPAGEIPGYPVERDSETGRVCTSAIGERVFDQGETADPGNCGGQKSEA